MKKCFFLKTNPMTFFKKKWKFLKSHFFRKSDFPENWLLRKKWLFENFHFFVEKCHRIFISRKEVFSWNFSIFSLFMISHPQAVQCWTSNSSTYTFGHGLCVRRFSKKSEKSRKSSSLRHSNGICIDLQRLKKTIAILILYCSVAAESSYPPARN